MANQHDNLKAGLLLIAGIFLAIGVVLVITWSKFQALLQPSKVAHMSLDGYVIKALIITIFF